MNIHGCHMLMMSQTWSKWQGPGCVFTTFKTVNSNKLDHKLTEKLMQVNL